jgi:hypothetical protein
MLHDQFGDTRAVAMDVAHFCNPARKVHRDKPTEISNPDAHLAFYRLKIEGQRREQRVTVSNQFGAGQRILVEDAVFLAVPTQKLRPQPHGRPAGLDHFLCYQAKGASMNLQLGLADQFIRQGVRVYETYVLCNPTEKRTEQAKVGIRNVDDHLMCYRMRGDAYEGKVQIRNQFGDGGFPVRNPNVLCVPSKKSPPPVK